MGYINKNGFIFVVLTLIISLLAFMGSDRRVSIDIDFIEQEEISNEVEKGEESRAITEIINKYIDGCENWDKDMRLPNRSHSCATLINPELDSYYYVEDTCDNVGFSFYFSEPVKIKFFVLQNLLDDKEFLKNSKVREIKYHNSDPEHHSPLEYSENYEPYYYTFELENNNQVQWIEMEDVVTDVITIYVLSVYPGEISSDGDPVVSGCGIQKIEFFGHPINQ